MTDSILKCCPFCGKEPRYVTGCYIDAQGNDWPFAECDPCHVGSPVEFWNTRARPASEPKPACNTCADQGELYVGPGIAQYGAETQPEPIYRACPDCTRPAPAGVVQLPERMEPTQQWSYPGGVAKAEGWNAYREEYIRLNGAPK